MSAKIINLFDAAADGASVVEDVETPVCFTEEQCKKLQSAGVRGYNAGVFQGRPVKDGSVGFLYYTGSDLFRVSVERNKFGQIVYDLNVSNECQSQEYYNFDDLLYDLNQKTSVLIRDAQKKKGLHLQLVP